MPNLEERILERLYDRGDGFFSLDELASAAACGRAELEAALESLTARGGRFEFSPADGVRLAGPIPLSAHLIERDLGTRRVGLSVLCFQEAGSTSDVAFDAARNPDADGLVVFAESQRSGRGRAGRAWLSAPGRNLLFSALLLDPKAQLAREPLTIAAGLAVAEGIEAACGLAAQLKWPNDVLLDGAKVAGVLVEVRAQGPARCVVIGIGVNVNASPPVGQVDSPATDLARHAGHPIERTEVARAVLRRLDAWMEAVAAGQWPELHDVWVARCEMLGRRVTVATDGRRVSGTLEDVSPLEGLTLRDDGGNVLHVPAAGATIVS